MTNFVTSQTLSTSLRNDYGGQIGVRFTVGSSDISVTSLGRWKVLGNLSTHTLELRSVSGYTLLATVDVDMSIGSSGSYNYVSLDSPVTLNSGDEYVLYTREFTGVGEDQWYDTGSSFTIASDFTTFSAVYEGSSLNFAGDDSMYGPVDFVYSISSSSSISPSFSPSVSPSLSPSFSPSVSPSLSPSFSPSVSPSLSPSFSPSSSPSFSPSSAPTDFPTSFTVFRVQENVPGNYYDETKTTRIYAEDFNLLRAAVSRIEQTLGLDVEGSADTVSDRIAALE